MAASTLKPRFKPLPWLIFTAFVVLLLWRMYYVVNVLEARKLSDFVSAFFSSVQLGSLYALIALGYTMVFGIIRLINFAHGEIFMVGAFVAYFFFANTPYTLPWAIFASILASFGLMYVLSLWRGKMTDPLVLGAGIVALIAFVLILTTTTKVSWILALVLSMLITAVVSISAERIAYRPLRRAPRISLLITAIAVSIFLQNFGVLAFTRNQTPYRPPTTWTQPIKFQIGEGTVNTTGMVILVPVITLILVTALTLFVNRTKLGKAMRASAQDPEVAQMMGIDVNRVISTTFALGAMLAAAGGVMWGLTFGNLLIPALVGVLPGIKAFAAAVIGGIGSLPGAVIGGVILGFMENFFPSLFPRTATFPGITEYKDTFAFLLLILVLLIKPSGIVGEDLSEKV
ncbi:MAG: branched-chain amino acid ABC transporter permease [Trueperaceae bacterium]